MSVLKPHLKTILSLCDSVIKDKQLKKQEFINKNSAESDILVPYAAYEKAYDICIGIGAIKEDDTQVLEDAVEQKTVTSLLLTKNSRR